jgi:hypothetical protein
MDKFMLALRGTHPQFIGESIDRFVKPREHYWISVLTSLQRQRISLPFPLGGLSTPIAADIALAAHLASHPQSSELEVKRK